MNSLFFVNNDVFNSGFSALLSIFQNRNKSIIDIAISVQPVADGICDEPYTKVVRPVINMIVPSLSVFLATLSNFFSLFK